MRHSIKTRLSLSFILVALVCVSLVSIMSNVILDKMFKEYKAQTQVNKNKEIVYWIGQQYGADGKWDQLLIENIGMNALEQGMIVKLVDSTGKVVWDAAVHNEGMCKEMLDDMAKKMLEHYPDWNGKYIVNPYSVSKGNHVVGQVEIGYYGPFYYDDNDMFFISTLNKLLVGVGAFSLLFSLILGALIAKHLSTPISKAVNAALNIANGYFRDKLSVKSNINEIVQLASAVNYLADTLEKQELLRKRLTTDVAHELRTPMSTLQSHIEAMVDGIWKPDAERLKCCHGEILRINKMVGDLEKLSRYDSEDTKLYVEQYDLCEQIRQVIVNFEADYANKGVQINFSGEKMEIMADRDKIGQVLVNLVSNALKYTPQGGHVEIGVNTFKDHVRISVKDDGKGIGSDDLPFIFERFYRVDKSRNRQTGGSGIGLTIARAIADMHGGSISAVSELGKGSEFVVLLPASCS